MEPKPISFSKVTMQRIIQPFHLNPGGNLFGGFILSWIDELAGCSALRHCAPNHNICTASILGADFLAPIPVGSMLALTAQVAYTGRTSMVVLTDAKIDNGDGTYQPAVRSAYLFVGLDENNRPTAVPQVTPETPEDEQRWAYAKSLKDAKSKK